MAARQGKRSTRSRAARKGWETRRAKAAELEKKRAAQARKRAATLKRKEREHEKRSAAAKKGARRHRARVRTQAALETWLDHAGQRDAHGEFVRETRVLHETWLRAKEELYDVSDDYEDFLGMLETIAEESDCQWDIAYGPGGEAAA